MVESRRTQVRRAIGFRSLGLRSGMAALAMLVLAAAAPAAELSPPWRRVVEAANATASAIGEGRTGPEAMSPLIDAQRELPPSFKRPIECWDMMVDAASKRRQDQHSGVLRAQEAARCYQVKASGRAAAEAAVAPAEAAAARAEWTDDDTRAHPNPPRVGSANPCLTADGHRVPDCRP